MGDWHPCCLDRDARPRTGTPSLVVWRTARSPLLRFAPSLVVCLKGIGRSGLKTFLFFHFSIKITSFLKIAVIEIAVISEEVSAVNKYVFKIAVAGDDGIGKKVFLRATCSPSPRRSMSIGIGVNFFGKITEIDGACVDLQVWGLSGQDRFRLLLPTYLHGASGVIIGFDVTRRQTFLNLEQWVRLVRDRLPTVPIYLMALKVDRPYAPSLDRSVVAQFTEAHGAIGFAEVSARRQRNIDTPLQELLRHIWDTRPVYWQVTTPVV